MTDYIQFLQKGIDSAKVAERNKAEVDAVFGELNRQLGEASNGRVSITRREVSDPLFLLSLASRPPGKREIRWALTAQYEDGQSLESKDIARWQQDQNGYPCRIEVNSGQSFCENKEGLERVLGALLADTSVGEVLRKYMSMANPNYGDSGSESGGNV